MKFIQYLKESSTGGAIGEEEKLVHLKHPEEHVVDSGHEGFKHTFHTLNDIHHAIKGDQRSSTSTSIKYDGSPSIVFGHHPETSKFFVASKSAFNKQPKINYSHEDIEKNHGHAPGLVSKLKDAFNHLQKVAPSKGVFQGDIMHTHDGVRDDGKQYHFTPNTITYSQSKTSPEGKKIGKAKIGVAVHTKYTGNNFEGMKAQYGFDAHSKDSGFTHHPDVHLLPTHVVHAANAPSTDFDEHMHKAVGSFNGATKDTFDAIHGHRVRLKEYVNHTVRTGTNRTAQEYRDWLGQKHQKEVDKMKSPAGKAKRQQQATADLQHVDANAHHFQRVMDIHDHLERAKDSLVKHLSSLDHHGYHHSINGKPSDPEGFVATRDNKPTKLVNRREFSQANFNRNG